ncbi:MAG TPA: HD domain-containing phosphohydrolase [Patescibacteria group bacterium]|nr:HD domain-containing phosphohydrolase [Patescibacteria group bacterium]
MSMDGELGKKKFLAVLREKTSAPVSTVLGCTEMLLEDVRGRALNNLLPYVSSIHTASERLLALYDRLDTPALLSEDESVDLATFRGKLRHDLCTPINVLKGYGEMMLEDTDADGLAILIPNLLLLLDACADLMAAIDSAHALSSDSFAASPQARSTEAPPMMASVMRTLFVPETTASPALKGRILLVDDNKFNLDVLQRRLLREGHHVGMCMNGADALALLAVESFDLILLDVMMSGMNGFEVLQALKADDGLRNIPVIMVSALDEITSIVRCIEAGAEDYLNKPINTILLRARINSCLERKCLRDLERTYRDTLEARVAERTRELAITQDITILTLATLTEVRDTETGNHIRRTQEYLRVLATRLNTQPGQREHLDEDGIALLCKTSVLHDIGKVGVPDSILLKPGRLTEDEFEIMKGHTVLGRDAIRTAEAKLRESGVSEQSVSYLRVAREVCGGHHEKWDGSGYPDRLSGTDIPLSARLMAIADVYDALISARPYKPAFPHEKAVEIIRQNAGGHFDPDLVTLFLANESAFRDIALHYGDEK